MPAVIIKKRDGGGNKSVNTQSEVIVVIDTPEQLEVYTGQEAQDKLNEISQ